MSRKPEAYSGHNSHFRALSAAAQSTLKTPGTSDTYSHYPKAEISTATVQLIDHVTEATAENSEQNLQTKRKNNSDNGKAKFF
jgi:hypothetical protein